MVEYFFTTHKTRLPDVLEVFFAEKDNSVIRSYYNDDDAIHLSAVGTWDTYKRLLKLPSGILLSLEHFEDDNPIDPFHSPEWTAFVQNEAISRGLTLTQMIVCIGKMEPSEFQIFERAYLNKFYQKYGRIL